MLAAYLCVRFKAYQQQTEPATVNVIQDLPLVIVV